RETVVPGLAYTVLMQPVPADSVDFYNLYEDNPDVQDPVKGNTFTGTVTGTFKSRVRNDLNILKDIPLSGILVELYDKDWGVDDPLGSDYVDENGNFKITYSTEQGVNEGFNLELYLKFISESPGNIRALNSGLSRYKIETAEWQAGASHSKVINKIIDQDVEDHNDAFRAVHWAYNERRYFQDNGMNIGSGLKIRINMGESAYQDGLNRIILTDNAANSERTTYHEFGHYAMVRLQGDSWNAWGTNGTSHNSNEENTSHIAWSEGWANAMQMIMDAVYREEDQEYGKKDIASTSPNYERSELKSAVNNGIRSEYYIACAIYDLWDGENHGQNLPTTIPSHPDNFIWSDHGWNDTDSDTDPGNDSWRTIDDVELSFYDICLPNIGNLYKTVQTYYTHLLSNVGNNCTLREGISRLFRENRVLWNISDFTGNTNIINLDSDGIGNAETYTEHASMYVTWTDNYVFNYYNKISVNTKSIPANADNSVYYITDDLWLGIPGVNESYLYLNASSDGVSNVGKYELCGYTGIDVKRGRLELGSCTGRRAELTINEKNYLRIWANGILNINCNSLITVKSGGTLFIQSGADININNGRIIVEEGGYLCIESGAPLYIQDDAQLLQTGLIDIRYGAILGVNPDRTFTGVTSTNCLEPMDMTHSGNGHILYECYTTGTYTHPSGLTLYSSPTPWNTVNFSMSGNLTLESGVTLEIINSLVSFDPQKQILVKSGAKLIVDNTRLTRYDCDDFWSGITVESGGELIIKNNSKIVLNGTGKIYIKPGGICRYEGGDILMEDATTALRLDGTLEIAPNTTFSLDQSGNGHIYIG
ncbi:MAG: hypothetical protein KJ607_02360, partial [Bacteroidetes bacterium]|nr:hypothetical protein [Bacteroidota bacterium]